VDGSCLLSKLWVMIPLQVEPNVLIAPNDTRYS
jgi:hypothetical protein